MFDIVSQLLCQHITKCCAKGVNTQCMRKLGGNKEKLEIDFDFKQLLKSKV